MARYGNLDALLENLKKQYGEELGWQHTVNMSDVGMMIEDAPTADVVPRSECEKWYCEYHAIKEDLTQEKAYHRETEKLVDRYCVELQKVKGEVAREIFDDFTKHKICTNEEDFGVLAELRKKYTEV